jgi:solute carrier family 9B (sodium/hydrogen exchanger), member 1/2
MIISVPKLSDEFKYSEAKYIAIIIAAYSVKRILGENNDDFPIYKFDRAILNC